MEKSTTMRNSGSSCLTTSFGLGVTVMSLHISMKNMERTLWTCWMGYFPLFYLILATTASLLLVMLLGLLPSTLDGGLMALSGYHLN
nr:AF195231_1 asparagine synthetase [Ipomoea batatas]